MDSTAYLTRHGWKGDGHSLHPSGRGIKKPLLVSRKTNVLGVGLKKNDAHADQWWLRAFDSSLKSMGVTKDAVTGVVGEVKKTEWNQLDLIKSGVGKWTGLYEGFVRGKTMGGSMGEETVTVLVKKEVDVAPKVKVESTTLGTFAAAVEELKEKKQKKRKAVDSPVIEQISHVTEPSREASEAERPRKKKKQKLEKEVIAKEEHIAKQEKMRRKEERRLSEEQAVSSAETTEDVEVTKADIKRQKKKKKKKKKKSRRESKD
jgi:nucleolar protein TMA23